MLISNTPIPFDVVTNEYYEKRVATAYTGWNRTNEIDVGKYDYICALSESETAYSELYCYGIRDDGAYCEAGGFLANINTKSCVIIDVKGISKIALSGVSGLVNSTKIYPVSKGCIKFEQ